MRGKLRDKPAVAKRDRLKREVMERHRPPRHESRSAALLNQRLEAESVPEEDEELVAAEQTRK